MKILITGHKGLIGSALLGEYSKNNDVVGYDKGDDFIDQKYDLIIHAAANCVIKETIKNPELSKENIDITYKIFELARKHRSRLVAFSSGRLSHEVYNPYTVSKRYLEMMAEAYKDCYDLDSMVIRPETVWGKSLNNERVVIKWIEAAQKNEPLMIFGPKDKELPPIYIDEFTRIVVGLIDDFDENKNEVLIVSGQIRKAYDIAQAIIDQIGSKSEILFKDSELTQPQKCEPAHYISKLTFEESLKIFLQK